MARIEKFEDVEAWQKARELTSAVYGVTNKGAFARDFGLCDQIRRASVSVMSNIAEGFDRGGNRELIQFLYIAKGSAAEVQAQLYVALDAGYLNQEQFQRLYSLAGDTSRLIGGFIRYLKTRNSKPATRNPSGAS
jgi:four helix bundle protein